MLFSETANHEHLPKVEEDGAARGQHHVAKVALQVECRHFEQTF